MSRLATATDENIRASLDTLLQLAAENSPVFFHSLYTIEPLVEEYIVLRARYPEEVAAVRESIAAAKREDAP